MLHMGRWSRSKLALHVSDHQVWDYACFGQRKESFVLLGSKPKEVTKLLMEEWGCPLVSCVVYIGRNLQYWYLLLNMSVWCWEALRMLGLDCEVRSVKVFVWTYTELSKFFRFFSRKKKIMANHHSFQLNSSLNEFSALLHVQDEVNQT